EDFLVTFLVLQKVTRRQGGTLSGHHPNNGYTPKPNTPPDTQTPRHPDTQPATPCHLRKRMKIHPSADIKFFLSFSVLYPAKAF
ncbi:hypothetical protein, partial [Pseudomonas sp. Xaverov 259]|uniref:hypothetical protein n=1 Tax=Pseudomonas sp. Xaverov 259 TaxID=2666086 RepID=UPI001C5AE29F